MKQFSIGWSLIRIYTFLVYLFLFAPIVVVMVLAFNPKQFGIFPMEGFSFRWFIKLAQNDAIIAAFKNSLVLGSLTAVLSTAIGILAAYGGEEFHREVPRVRLGILRLAGSDVAGVRRWTSLACLDYRDLLVEAEYRYSFGKAELRDRDPEKYARLQRREQDEYRQWLVDLLAI